MKPTFKMVTAKDLGISDETLPVLVNRQAGKDIITGWTKSGDTVIPVLNWSDLDAYFRNQKVSLDKRLLMWAKRNFVLWPMFDGCFDETSAGRELQCPWNKVNALIQRLVKEGKIEKRSCAAIRYELPEKVRRKLRKDFMMSIWNPSL